MADKKKFLAGVRGVDRASGRQAPIPAPKVFRDKRDGKRAKQRADKEMRREAGV